MTYGELLELVLSCTCEDWLADDERGIFTLKRDLDVTLRRVETEEPRAFKEPWATQFPDPNAFVQVYELWYRNSFVKDYYFASVDGDRASLPYPKAANNLTITREQRAIADAVNFSLCRDYFLEYVQRFKVAD